VAEDPYRYLKIVAAAFVAVGALAMLFVIRDLGDQIAKNRTNTRCLLHELTDHRQNNYEADRRTAQAVGAEVDDLTPPPTLPPGGEWRRACDNILGSDED
jgi:hypothetical protein